MTDEAEAEDEDDLQALRSLRPDRVLADDDPADPSLLARAREALRAAGGSGAATAAWQRTPAVYPRLAYRDEVAAIEFLVRAFGFRERREARMEHPTGTLAWLEIGDGVVMVGRAGADRHGLHSPSDLEGTTTMMNVRVADVDAHHARAKAEGAVIVSDLADMFWGERRYEAADLEGHRWHFTSPIGPDGDRP